MPLPEDILHPVGCKHGTTSGKPHAAMDVAWYVAK